MTLEQIDKRLSLFPDYLKYYIWYRMQYPEGYLAYQLDLMLKTGWLMSTPDNSYNLMSFDEWLYENKFYDLTNSYKQFPGNIVEIGGLKFRQYSHDGVNYNLMLYVEDRP